MDDADWQQGPPDTGLSWMQDIETTVRYLQLNRCETKVVVTDLCGVGVSCSEWCRREALLTDPSEQTNTSLPAGVNAVALDDKHISETQITGGPLLHRGVVEVPDIEHILPGWEHSSDRLSERAWRGMMLHTGAQPRFKGGLFRMTTAMTDLEKKMQDELVYQEDLQVMSLDDFVEKYGEKQVPEEVSKHQILIDILEDLCAAPGDVEARTKPSKPAVAGKPTVRPVSPYTEVPPRRPMEKKSSANEILPLANVPQNCAKTERRPSEAGPLMNGQNSKINRMLEARRTRNSAQNLPP